MKKLRVGIIGTGSLAGFHLGAYCKNPEVEVTAVCDANGDRARQKAREFNISEAYDNYQEMFEKGNVDAVSVITWNSTHAPITIAALNAGKHVLCEKPPALNAAEALMMQEAARKNGRLLMFGFVRRFAQNTCVLKEYIDNGDLGEIYYAKTGYLRRCGNPGGWFARKEISGGGPLIDLGVHIIDLSIYLMGGHKPVSVFGSTYNKLGSKADVKYTAGYKAADFSRTVEDVEDMAAAIIKFENGASLFFETSWTLNIKADSFYAEYFGDRGGAKLEPEMEIYSEKNGYMYNMKPVISCEGFNAEQAFTDQINHFVDCALNGKQCICPAEDGVRIMKILDAVYESSRTGREVILV